MSFPRILGLTLAAAAVVVVPGCGEEETQLPSESARVFLDRALSNPPESARASVDVDLAGGSLGLPVGVAGELDGPYEAVPGSLPRFSLDYDLDVAGLGFQGTVTLTDGALYVDFFGDNYRQPLDAAELQPLDADSLDLARDAAYDGVAEVDGVDTALIESAATIEVPVPGAPLGGDASVAVPELKGTVQAWVGVDDGMLRRLWIEGRGVSVELELSELGESFEFKPPEGGGFRSLSDLVERFRGML